MWDQGNGRRDPSTARFVLRCVLEKKLILDVSLNSYNTVWVDSRSVSIAHQMIPNLIHFSQG